MLWLLLKDPEVALSPLQVLNKLKGLPTGDPQRPDFPHFFLSLFNFTGHFSSYHNEKSSQSYFRKRQHGKREKVQLWGQEALSLNPMAQSPGTLSQVTWANPLPPTLLFLCERENNFLMGLSCK